MNYEKIIDIVSGQNSPWKYANSTKLLDVRNDLGFNSDNFNQKWAEGVENLQLLLSYLKEKEKN